MTTIAVAPLSETLQTLVDARLDTIDRMLLGRVNRQDRLAIVREVEAQIHDLLQDRDPNSLDREDVLAVLARLDPPEAYLADEPDERAPAARTGSHPLSIPREPRGIPRVSRVSGILGLVAMGMVSVSVGTFFVADATGSELLVYLGTFGSIGLTFLLGVLATALSSYAKLRGAWAVVGLVTGIIATLTALVGGLTILFQI